MDVYLEHGKKRAFAVAVDWPGLARSGSDEGAALQALVDHGARYAEAMRLPARAFVAPRSVGELQVIERVGGNESTDFGVPGHITRLDERPTDEAELDRLTGLLRRAWETFTRTADGAEGRELRPAGPRGGGRTLVKMRAHVVEAEQAYVGALGGRAPAGADWPGIQLAFLEALRARAHGDLPDRGPRGGRRWPARYAVRRSAWHALDHAWEIEDRLAAADIRASANAED